MLWLVFCKRNYLKNCTTTRTPTNYLQLLPCHPQIYKWSKEIRIINKMSDQSIKKRLLSVRKCYNLSRLNNVAGMMVKSKHCILPTWHSKHFRKPAKNRFAKKVKLCCCKLNIWMTIWLVLQFSKTNSFRYFTEAWYLKFLVAAI